MRGAPVRSVAEPSLFGLLRVFFGGFFSLFGLFGGLSQFLGFFGFSLGELERFAVFGFVVVLEVRFREERRGGKECESRCRW